MTDMRLDGKTVVVTGGASGIGKATAFEMARAGGHVIIADVNEEGAAAALREAEAAGLKLEYMKLDLTSPESIDRFSAQALERFGRVDVLVNAAGWGKIQPFVDNTPDFWTRVVAVNLTGPVQLTQKLLPAMMATHAGKIVNVSSDAGRVGSLGETMYAAAKGGMIAFTKSLAREAARGGVNVNCICPGPTDTPLMQAVPEKFRDAFIKAIPFHRLGKPQEVADAILFFATPGSDFVTGQVLSVSGGLTLAG
jgi:2-hydroxycyclohexanecarboxyl-CoA dehydrogenase